MSQKLWLDFIPKCVFHFLLPMNSQFYEARILKDLLSDGPGFFEDDI